MDALPPVEAIHEDLDGSDCWISHPRYAYAAAGRTWFVPAVEPADCGEMAQNRHSHAFVVTDVMIAMEIAVWNLLQAAGVALMLASPAAAATNVTVEMLNKDPVTAERNVYSEEIVRVDVGDTVTWVATDRGHNVEFISGAVPMDVDRFRSRLSQDVSYTFETPGVYAYKCTPHYGLGMVGIVVVGEDLSNLAAVERTRYPGRAKARMQAILALL